MTMLIQKIRRLVLYKTMIFGFWHCQTHFTKISSYWKLAFSLECIFIESQPKIVFTFTAFFVISKTNSSPERRQLCDAIMDILLYKNRFCKYHRARSGTTWRQLTSKKCTVAKDERISSLWQRFSVYKQSLGLEIISEQYEQSFIAIQDKHTISTSFFQRCSPTLW